LRPGVSLSGDEEHSQVLGPPREYPDRADLSVRRDGDRLVLSIDAMAGDHGTGHADVTVTRAEARALATRLAEAADRVPDADVSE